MSDTARDYQTIETASTEGLEDLFANGAAVSAEAKPLGSASDSEASSGSAEGLTQWLPIDQAAKRLGISKNAVQKRLKRGKLNGKKVAGDFGDIWLIDLSNEPQVLEIQFESEPGSASPGSAKPEGVASEAVNISGSAEGLAMADKLDLMLQVELLNRVERLSIENGRLSTLLQERDNQIRLLTDSQHKTGWWARFSSWFLGSK